MGGLNISVNIGIDVTGLLVSSWALSITWGILVMQLATYAQNRKRDHPFLQAVVFFLFVNETVSMVLSYVALQHQAVVVQPGTLESLTLPSTGIIMSFFNHITLCAVNLFVIWRYHRFTRRWWVTIPLSLATVASCATYWYNNIMGLRIVHAATRAVDIVKTFELLDKVMQSAKAAGTLEFVAVTSTYVLLLIQLSSYLRGDLLTAKKIVRRLIFMTLESGTATVALAAANFANAFLSPDPNALSIVITIAARTYYMTMLFNLNWRNEGGMVMGQPSLSHLSSQLLTQPSVQLSDVSSFGAKQSDTIIHIRQYPELQSSEHEKRPYPLLRSQ